MIKSSLRTLSLFVILGAFFLKTPSVWADPLTGLKVQRSGSQILISWNAYPGSDKFEGYALQWANASDKIKITEAARQYLQKDLLLAIRGADFAGSTDYYFRVYTYYTNDKKKVLQNGSKILRWKENRDGTLDTAEFSANDPVIVNPATASSGVTTKDFDFINFGLKGYDTFVDLEWSTPNLASSEYDGTMIEISDKADLSTTLGTLKAETNQNKGRITGLSPNTTYYLRASFHKSGNRLGAPQVKNIKMIAAVPRDGKTIASRNIQKIEDKKLYPTIDLSQVTISTASTTSGTSTPSSATSTSSTSFNIETATKAQIEARITEVEKALKTYKAELAKLEAKLEKLTPAKKKKK